MEKYLIPKWKDTDTSNPNFNVNVTEEDREEPRCSYFGDCGGCQLQHISYQRQLAEKHHYLKSILAKFVHPDFVKSVIPSPHPFHYRRRAQFQVNRHGEVGFFRRSSKEIIPVKYCPLLCHELNQAIPDVEKMAKGILQTGKFGLELSIEATLNAEGNVEIARADGAERAFLQINSEANQKLIHFLIKYFKNIHPKKVLELFAGSGNFTEFLRPFAEEWIAVESNTQAFQLGLKNSQKLALKTQWKNEKSHQILKWSLKNKYKYDVVLLDPPREGAENCMELLGRLAPYYIIYVSCNPVSLKRDLALLIAAKYIVELVQPFDFFPQTTHIENVTILKKSIVAD